MKTALQSAYLTAVTLLGFIGGQFAFFGFMTGNCTAWIISLFCFFAAVLTIVIRSKMHS